MIHRRGLLAALVVGSLAATLVGCSDNPVSPNSPTDLSPPQAPTNLHSTEDPATSREWLVWDPSASASVASYEVYSTDTPGGSDTYVATLDAGTYQFVLPLVVESTTEYYRVRAIGTNDVPSAFTSTIGVDRGSFEGTQTKGKPGKGTEVE